MTNEVSLDKLQDTKDSRIDVAAEMKQIRDLVRQQVPSDTSPETDIFDDGLNELRANWNVQPFQFESSVPVIGPLIAVFRTAWNGIATKWQVRHILGQQNNFNLIVYHLLRDLCQEVGVLSQEASDLSRRTGLLDQRMTELSLGARQLVQDVEHGKAVLDEVAERLEELDLRLISTRNLVSARNSAGQVQRAEAEGSPSAAGSASSEGCDYLDFNARFTALGSVVRKTYRQYLPLFEGRGSVLDAGCGQGHFLELLQELDVDGYGVDIDEEMVELCRLKGLRAQVGDVVAHLSDLPDESLGGIFSGHLIEHLDPPALRRFLTLAHRALCPGGILVCETPNTRSLFVLANTFYRDPTHKQPVHPETYQFMAQAEGFVDVELRYSLSAPDDRAIKPISAPEGSDPSMQVMVRKLNQRLQRIDETVFGYQNVALVARKADRASGGH